MVSESALYPPIEEHFQKEYLIAREVPFASKKIDMVCARPKNFPFRSNELNSNRRSTSHTFEEIIAIEMKVKKWKRALRQALIYQLGANKVYVALWHTYVRNINLEYFDRFGIGLIAVDGEIHTIRNPVESPHMQNEYTALVERHLFEQM